MPVFLLLYIISFIPYDKFQKACIAVILILWIKKLQRREVTLTSWSKPQAWVMKPDFSYFTAYVLITEFLPPLCSHMMCIWLAEVIQSLYFKDNPPPPSIGRLNGLYKVHIPSHYSLGGHLELSTGISLEIIFFCPLNFQNVYYGI